MIPPQRVLPAIVVDVVPADANPEQAKAMIDACTQAMRHGDCALSSEVPESSRPESIALVIWQGDARVSIRVSRGDGEWASRQIQFSAADAIGDRWTTVGLTVATLADETRPEGAPGRPVTPASSPAAPPPSAPNGTDSDKASPASNLSFALAAGGIVGTGWDDGGAQRGAWATASAGLPNLPIFAAIGARYAWSEGPGLGTAGALDSRWYDVSFGIGLFAVVRPIRLRVFGAPELALQFVSATLTGSNAALADHEARLRVRGGIAWPADGHVGAVLGGTMRILPFAGEGALPNHAGTSRVAADLFGGIELRL